jgi:hypothetical protein
LKDFWKVNDKLSISNLAYVSIGRGGGTRIFNSGALLRDSTGLIDWDQIEFYNKVNSLFGTPNIDASYLWYLLVVVWALTVPHMLVTLRMDQEALN